MGTAGATYVQELQAPQVFSQVPAAELVCISPNDGGGVGTMKDCSSCHKHANSNACRVPLMHSECRDLAACSCGRVRWDFLTRG